MADVQRLDPRRAPPFQPARVFDVRDDDGNRRIESPVADRVDERLQVAAATGDENAQPAINGVGGHFSRTDATLYETRALMLPPFNACRDVAAFVPQGSYFTLSTARPNVRRFLKIRRITGRSNES